VTDWYFLDNEDPRVDDLLKKFAKFVELYKKLEEERKAVDKLARLIVFYTQGPDRWDGCLRHLPVVNVGGEEICWNPFQHLHSYIFLGGDAKREHDAMMQAANFGIEAGNRENEYLDPLLTGFSKKTIENIGNYISKHFDGEEHRLQLGNLRDVEQRMNLLAEMEQDKHVVYDALFKCARCGVSDLGTGQVHGINEFEKILSSLPGETTWPYRKQLIISGLDWCYNTKEDQCVGRVLCTAEETHFNAAWAIIVYGDMGADEDFMVPQQSAVWGDSPAYGPRDVPNRYKEMSDCLEQHILEEHRGMSRECLFVSICFLVCNSFRLHTMAFQARTEY
jgi:hypothetical protein